MVTSISNPQATANASGASSLFTKKSETVTQTTARYQSDTVSFGQGSKPDQAQAMNMVLERAYNKLKGIVDDARSALGIPEGAVLDTSPEATAGRIADFALGFFDKYAKQHGLADDEAGRQQFADFIGGAIGQGIDEARGILSALQVLDGDTSSKIDQTASIIQQRLSDFVKNGASGKTDGQTASALTVS